MAPGPRARQPPRTMPLPGSDGVGRGGQLKLPGSKGRPSPISYRDVPLPTFYHVVSIFHISK